MNPKFSIIIVNYNTGDLTLKCLESIKEYPPKVPHEIIVVDNGSSDGSIGKIKTQPRSGLFNSKLKTATQKLKLIRNKENVGFARANNQGIKIAKGKYVLLLNSDTEVKKGAIDALYEFAQKRADAGVVGVRLLNADGDVQPSVFHFPTLIGAFAEYWLGKRGSYESYAPAISGPTLVDSVVGAAFLITPQALKKVGLLDEHYFMYFEDLDYCRRVWKTGLKVYYLPSAEVIHHHGASGRSLAASDFQWRRLVPSSKIYHGFLMHHLINLVIWTGQKWRRILHSKLP